MQEPRRSVVITLRVMILLPPLFDFSRSYGIFRKLSPA
jgi:hypothetical protein